MRRVIVSAVDVGASVSSSLGWPTGSRLPRPDPRVPAAPLRRGRPARGEGRVARVARRRGSPVAPNEHRPVLPECPGPTRRLVVARSCRDARDTRPVAAGRRDSR